MRKHSLCTSGLFVGFLALAGLLLTPSVAAAFKYIQDGMDAPVVQGTDLLTGETVSSEAVVEGEVVIVSFWATWSDRSLEILDDLKDMTERYKEYPFRVIAVNVEAEKIPPETVEMIKERIESMGLPFPVIIDQGLEIFYAYGVIAVPSTALLNPDGSLRYGPAGYSYTVRDRMVDSTEVLLGIREIDIAEALPEPYQPDVTSSRYYYLGLQLVGEGMLERAIEHIARAAEADPKFSAPHRLRGEVLLELNQAAEAAVAFQKAVELDSTSVSAWAGWGRALVWDDNTAAGREKLERAIEMDESYTPAILDLALCRCQEGEVEIALDMLREAQELNPLDPAIHFNLGQCYRMAGMDVAAVEAFHAALRLLYPESR